MTHTNEATINLDWHPRSKEGIRHFDDNSYLIGHNVLASYTIGFRSISQHFAAFRSISQHFAAFTST